MGGRGSKSGSGIAQQTLQSPPPAPAPPTSVAQTVDIDEAAKFMQDNYNVSVDADSLRNMDFVAVKDALEAVQEIMTEFPNADFSSLTVFGDQRAYESLAAANLNGSLKLNTLRYDDAQKLSDGYDKGVKNGFHPAGTSARDVVAHEMGHMLERSLVLHDVQPTVKQTQSFGGFAAQIARSEAWRKCTMAGKVINEAARAVKKTPAGKGKKTDQIVSSVSRYATKSRSEALAECIADYRANGANANALSKEVWKILKREYG